MHAVIYNRYGQFAEIADLVADTLRRLGCVVEQTENVDYRSQKLHIMFGMNVWDDTFALPRRFIIFQLEQHPIKKWFNPKYFARLACAEQVWDYNLGNVEFIRNCGIDAKHVPIAYSPIYRHPVAMREDVDCLFIGQIGNAYRKHVFGIITASGINLTLADNVYGQAKKELVSRAKVILNVHYGFEALFEEARVVPLLSAGRVVISESVKDKRYHDLYGHVVDFVDSTAEMVERIKYWLTHDRRQRQQTAMTWMQSRTALQLFPFRVEGEKFIEK